VSRLRRLQASLMTSAAYEGLQKVLEPLLEPYPQQVDLARAWAARDKAAIKRVDERSSRRLASPWTQSWPTLSAPISTNSSALSE